MPHQPGFRIPTVSVPVEVTWTEVGRADESGVVVLSRLNWASPMGTHGSSELGNSSLPWKALFWMSSAYIPPSPEWLMSSNWS